MTTTTSLSVIAAPGRTKSEWVEQARSVEQLGFRRLLVPDTLWTASPFPALAAAAAVTEEVRLRTWVLAAPMRSPAAVVREASALQQLSDGRFELGLGTGRPDARAEAERLGLPWLDGPGRLAQLEAVASAVRTGVTPVPPVVVAASGPMALAAAGRVADRVCVALGPSATAAELSEAVARTRQAAPAAALTMQVMGVGERIPEYMVRQGLSGADLAAAGSVSLLPADPSAIADRLGRYAEELGVDEVIVPAEFARDVAPVIALL